MLGSAKPKIVIFTERVPLLRPKREGGHSSTVIWTRPIRIYVTYRGDPCLLHCCRNLGNILDSCEDHPRVRVF